MTTIKQGSAGRAAPVVTSRLSSRSGMHLFPGAWPGEPIVAFITNRPSTKRILDYPGELASPPSHVCGPRPALL